MTRDPPSTRLLAANLALAILAFINLFNYLDRYVVAAVFESLKRSELSPSDAELGWLMSGFLIVYTIAAPIFGALGDSRARPRLIAFGVAVWSVATALSGFAGSFLALLAARASVGIGEAAYGTIAPSLLADYFPANRRGRVMAIFFCAIPVGSALGYVVGGLIDQHFGWRTAFFAAGAPGLLLAGLCLLLHDPPRGAQDAGAAPGVAAGTTAGAAAGATAVLREAAAPAGTGGPSLLKRTFTTYRRLLGNTPYVITVLGYAAYTFAVGGLASWMPSFLERVRGVPKVQATVSFGAIVVVTGFVGTFVGGWLGDYAQKRSSNAFLKLSATATLLAAPLVYGALTTPSRAGYIAYMVGAQFLIFLSTGPINAVIVNLVSPLERASAVALSVFTIHLLGDCISPSLIGYLSDATTLGTAVKIVPLAVLIAGLLWSWAAGAQSLRRTGPALPAA